MTIASILVTALGIFYQVLAFAILIRCILSWLPIGRDNFFVRIVVALTEPILGPIRRPLGGGMMIDFSPVIAYFLIDFVYRILIRIIISIF